MATPALIAQAFLPADAFAASRSLSVDLGTGAGRAVLVIAFQDTTFNAAWDFTGVTVGGVSCTAGIDVPHTTGAHRKGFWLTSGVPEGVQNIVLNNTSNARKSGFKVYVFKDAATESPSISIASLGSPPRTTPDVGVYSYTLDSSPADLLWLSVVAIGNFAGTPAAGASTTHVGVDANANGSVHTLSRVAGAGTSSTMVATYGATNSTVALGFKITGSAPAAMTFTGTVGAQTGVVGTAFNWSGAAMSSFFSGGSAPYSYTLLSGTLPAGLSISSSTGQVTGTPSAVGSATIVVVAIDSVGASVSSNAFTVTVSPAPASATTLSGPSGGVVGVASSSFTVGANGAITGTVTVTPSDGGGGGTFTPTSVTISSGTPTATFTYTPGSEGAKTISISDNGSLTDAASLTYTATLTQATITVTGIRNGTGTLLASVTFPNVVVIRRSNRTLVMAATNQTTNGSGNLVLTSGTLPAGVPCQVVAFSDDGTQAGCWPATPV